MSWRKFDTIYVNGCSHTAGGGLYDDGTKELYEEIYGLTWKTEREVNYPKLLSKHFNCDLIECDLDEYNDLLIKLKDFLIDKYDIFLILHFQI